MVQFAPSNRTGEVKQISQKCDAELYAEVGQLSLICVKPTEDSSYCKSSSTNQLPKVEDNSGVSSALVIGALGKPAASHGKKPKPLPKPKCKKFNGELDICHMAAFAK